MHIFVPGSSRVLGTRLTRQDRPRWAAARNRADLGLLTALWLDGRIDSQPAYYGKVDVDEDLAPGMTDTLIRLNEAGFLTQNSQAGSEVYQQQASVNGFASPEMADRLRQLANDEVRCTVLPPRGRFRRGQWDHDAQCTWHVTASEIAHMYEGAGAEAIDDLVNSSQVTVYDTRIGRNDLWPALDSVVATSEDTDEYADEA